MKGSQGTPVLLALHRDLPLLLLSLPVRMPEGIGSCQLGLAQAAGSGLQLAKLRRLLLPHVEPCHPASRQIPAHDATSNHTAEVLHAFLFFLGHFLQRLELCLRHASIERSDALKQVAILRLGNVKAPLQVEAHALELSVRGA